MACSYLYDKIRTIIKQCASISNNSLFRYKDHEPTKLTFAVNIYNGGIEDIILNNMIKQLKNITNLN